MIRDGSSGSLFAWLVGMAAFLGLVVASCSREQHSSSAPQARPALWGEGSQTRSIAFGGDPNRDTSRSGTRVPSRAAVGDPAGSATSVQKGKQVFDTTGCAACHKINGQGGSLGSDLSNEANQGRSRQWLVTKIRNPKADNPQTTMPAYTSLSDEQVNDLTDYMLSLSTAAGPQTGQAPAPRAESRPAPSATLVAEGGELWTRRCGQCHNLRPPSEYNAAQWAVAVHHMRVRVPLTGEEQRRILAFLQASH